PPTLVEASCDVDAPCRDRTLTLTLAAPVAPDASRLVRVTPLVRDLRIDVGGFAGEGGERVSVRGSFEPGRTYALALAAKLASVDGHALGAPIVHRARFAMPPASLQLSATSGTVVAGAPPAVGLYARHVTAARLTVRAVRHPDAEAIDPPLAERALALRTSGK